ncbi:CoA transferase [Nonomuraea sp. NPDC050663]|uniref:CoA transferase n=1 Tax=Nonomuraea sp. NPDC050663 TaxID=3364370 RepID=UPI0037BB3018
MFEREIAELASSVQVELAPVRIVDDGARLPSTFKVEEAAAVSVGAALGAAAGLVGGEGELEMREALAAFQDERFFRINNKAPLMWAPFSGDYRAADGWVRLHCNFDHHREAVLRALGLRPKAEREEVEEACAGRTAREVEDAVTAEGGCAGALRTMEEWAAHPQARAVRELPLVGMERVGDAPAGGGRRRDGERPLEGVRVLDLTRVIAGPVATRTLAAYGAKVLRVGAPALPEVAGLVVSTAFGKRSTLLDLRAEKGARRFRELVAGADVIVRGYRPGALEGLGFGVGELAGLRPGVVCVDISAYGGRGPWGMRRGFDSLVQMVTGIAYGDEPAPLPAQVLDHATGYLAAFGAMGALARQRREGGSWRVELSLARTAQWLVAMGQAAPVDRFRMDGLLGEMESTFGELTYVLPPGRIDGRRPGWTGPPPMKGQHHPEWW